MKKTILKPEQKPLHWKEKLAFALVDKINLSNLARIVLLYFNYKLVENELIQTQLRIVTLKIGETLYTIPLLLLLFFPILLNLGLMEFLIRIWKYKISQGKE